MSEYESPSHEGEFESSLKLFFLYFFFIVFGLGRVFFLLRNGVGWFLRGEWMNLSDWKRVLVLELGLMEKLVSDLLALGSLLC
jgi:hypothetical protein